MTEIDYPHEDMPILFKRLAIPDLRALGEIARRLWPRLRAIARRRLKDEPELSAVYSEEDAIQSSLVQIMRGLVRGKLHPIEGEDHFVRLFRTIVHRRIMAAKARRGTHERNELTLPGRLSKLERLGLYVPDCLDLLECGLPEPEVVAMAKEELEWLLSLLGSELHSLVLDWLNGLTVEETAAKRGQSRRTIERRGKEIRDLWKLARFED
jgi:DNA-directed RNA polymerase specialized sigma24 family protein